MLGIRMVHRVACIASYSPRGLSRRMRKRRLHRASFHKCVNFNSALRLSHRHRIRLRCNSSSIDSGGIRSIHSNHAHRSTIQMSLEISPYFFTGFRFFSSSTSSSNWLFALHASAHTNTTIDPIAAPFYIVSHIIICLAAAVSLLAF